MPSPLPVLPPSLSGRDSCACTIVVPRDMVMSEFHRLAQDIRHPLRLASSSSSLVPRAMLRDGRPWESLAPGVELRVGAHVRLGGADAGLDPSQWFIGEILDQPLLGRWTILLGSVPTVSRSRHTA